MVTHSANLTGLRDHPVLGIASFVGNLAIMALLAAGVRELVNRGYPLGEVLLLRYAFAFSIFWVIMITTASLAVLATRNPVDHAIRSISGVMSLSMLYFAITPVMTRAEESGAGIRIGELSPSGAGRNHICLAMLR